MNIFGMGPAEMAVIAIIALIVFGPGKLPEVMGQVGKAIRDFRRMTADLTGEFEKTIGTDLNDMRNQLTGGLSGLTSEVNNVTESVKRDLAGTSTSSSTAASSSTSTTSTSDTSTWTAPASTSGSVISSNGSANGSSSTAPKPKPVASKHDPLADVSFMDDIVASNGHSHEPVPVLVDDSVNTHGSIAAAPASPNGATTEAVARARQRRQAAGYGRRSPGRIN